MTQIFKIMKQSLKSKIELIFEGYFDPTDFFPVKFYFLTGYYK